MKKHSLPPELSSWIDKQLQLLGYNLTKAPKLAKAILRISNDYQDVASVTPWKEPESQAAYLAYFFPLNYIRSLKVLDEAQTWNFFDGVEEVLDFGCGPGTLTKALMQNPFPSLKTIQGVDLYPDLANYFLDTAGGSVTLDFQTQKTLSSKSKNLLVASYVLNELKETPSWFYDFEKIMILEPSTKQAFPRLLKLRQQLIEQGYDIVAPCPHHHQCPMAESKRDWCHDRVHWNQPEWFQRIEGHLPIKNKTLTYSYLLASRTPIKKPFFGRVVGDAQIEKGKTRWMICQGPEREFLSFLKRQGKAPEIFRGERVQLGVFEKKADEVRFELDQLKKV